MRHIIIGAGAAGIQAAKTIRAAQPDAVIIMISTDKHVHSRCMLHKYLSHERDEAALSFIPEDFFEKLDIFWVKDCSVSSVDTVEKTVSLEDGMQFSYDKLLIATGANSFIPPVGQFREANNVFGLRHLSDAQSIRPLADKAENILVVGSGLVGMDAAYAFLEQGKSVTVVEMADRILPLQLDEIAGNTYREQFEAHGCRFLLGRKASETVMNGSGAIEAVILDDGTRVDCDLVIVAAGVRPAIECVQGSDIKAERFIEVDSNLKTNCADVYAAGDVAGLSGIWPNAMKQGETAAYNMCGMNVEYIDRYAMKNTMNFYGITTLSLGRGIAQEGDTVLTCHDSKGYKRAILRDGKLDSILLQGSIDYTGVYQYVIKNQIDLSQLKTDVFQLSFADFYGVDSRGQYMYP
ncbi:MAG: FAD-dependent oxidoreductase [Eubacteriales bacterium]|nr:FAD-dependent oxidoreductase [Eubacteriales bacterium]